MRHAAIVVALSLFWSVGVAQIPPIGPHCGARVCEAVTIYASALDSVLKRPHAEGVGAPRLLRSLYLAPFDAFRQNLPVVGQLDATSDLNILRQYWPTAEVLDSARVVARDGHTLRPGGPLYIASPIDWTGEDAARFQLAEYPRDLLWGAQLFVLLRRGPGGWHVTEITVGAIN